VARIKIHRIVYDPPGKDTRENDQLNKEMIVLHNTGAKDRNISSWRVRDRAGYRYVIPTGFTLKNRLRVVKDRCRYAGGGTSVRC
jgi:hypothetical protein